MKKRKMEPSEIALMARSFSTMVRVQGPDPKGLKMRKHAFHLHQSGKTTLSASGLLLPLGCLHDMPQIVEYITRTLRHSGGIVMTMASVIEPFLIAQHRSNPSKEIFPKLIPGACIDLLVVEKGEGSKYGAFGTTSSWLPSQLLAIVDVSTSSSAIMSLIGAHKGSHEQVPWEAGWSMTPLSADPLTGSDAFQRQNRDGDGLSYESSNPTAMAESATRIAILGCSTGVLKDELRIETSQPKKRGDMLLVMGSPFGILSPLHFRNSISVGAIANIFPMHTNLSSLLMADIRCLPGMEGAPAFDRYGCLTGILTRPLKQKGSLVEIQLVITWEAIVHALSGDRWNESLRSNTSKSGDVLPRSSSFSCASQSSLEKAISSVVLVTVGDGAWASGIVLNKQGLVLTNAHILEPWRFGRTSLFGLMDPINQERYLSHPNENKYEVDRHSSSHSQLGSSNSNGHAPLVANSRYKSYKKIAVRLDHMDHQIWYKAKAVYVSRGPWDVALLQVESVPIGLCPITTENTGLSVGSTIHVIGHGLLGPKSDILPSVSSGFLANIVRTEKSDIPVMLQTTAAVHPGASGGAVVNSDGRMIGLVTSNAKHDGGTVIPHLNFSIPCAALKPIFDFADKQDISLLQVLDSPNETISSIWALQTPQSPMLKASLENTKRDGKGTKFSQFLAEKNTELNVLKDGEKIMEGKFRSRI